MNRLSKTYRVGPKTRPMVNKALMPRANPTGNPFVQNMPLPSNSDDLKKLQVRVMFNKIGEAPRSYAQRLIEAQNMRGVFQGNQHSHSPLCERFQRIEFAQRAMTPMTIKLLNEKRENHSYSGPMVQSDQPNNLQNSPRLTQNQRVGVERRLANRK